MNAIFDNATNTYAVDGEALTFAASRTLGALIDRNEATLYLPDVPMTVHTFGTLLMLGILSYADSAHPLYLTVAPVEVNTVADARSDFHLGVFAS